jgi:3-methyladenine DNA glycosylase AlkD
MDVEALTAFASSRLAAIANPEKAAPMAAYMKTDQPFYGVPKPGRSGIFNEMIDRFAPGDRDDYRTAVLALWGQPHREEQYLAIGYAKAVPRYITLSSVPLYRRLVVEGAWWDFVDDIATSLVGCVLRNQRNPMTPKIRAWIDDRDLWLRRTAIIGQLGHKEATDESLLFDACVARLGEQEFFIRKAIGWALRDYAKTNPAAVRSFVLDHREEMSGLSLREATKHLDL